MRPGMPTGRPWVINSPQPAADAPALPLLAFDNLHHCAWLQVPMWVFDIERMRVCWANTAGLDAWRANQLAKPAPPDFSDASPATLLRLCAPACSCLPTGVACASPGRSTRWASP